jgi:hypothetical protein
MELTYVGPHDGVDVTLLDGSEVTVMRGASETFAEEIAASLLAQGEAHWIKTLKASKEKK